MRRMRCRQRIALNSSGRPAAEVAQASVRVFGSCSGDWVLRKEIASPGGRAWLTAFVFFGRADYRLIVT